MNVKMVDSLCPTPVESECSTMQELLASLDERQLTGDARSYEIGKFIKHKAWEDGIPLSGSFELTPLCNLDCTMCYVHESHGRYSVQDLLPSDVWIKCIDDACRSGMLFAQITGGECLTYPDFDRVYLYLLSQGVSTSVLSNGILLTQERVAFFTEYKPHLIQVSLYGSSEDAYERVTGKRMFRKAIEGIRRLISAGIYTEIAITVSRPMLPDLPDLKNLVSELDIPYSLGCDLMPPNKDRGRDFDEIRLTSDEIVYARSVFSNDGNPSFQNKEMKELPEPQSYSGCEIALGMPCGSGRSSFTITWNGKMIPCNAVADVGLSVLDHDFKDAWEHVKHWAKNHLILQSCKKCQYRPVCKRCPMMHELCTGKAGTVDTAFCDTVRKCVGMGILRIDQ